MDEAFTPKVGFCATRTVSDMRLVRHAYCTTSTKAVKASMRQAVRPARLSPLHALDCTHLLRAMRALALAYLARGDHGAPLRRQHYMCINQPREICLQGGTPPLRHRRAWAPRRHPGPAKPGPTACCRHGCRCPCQTSLGHRNAWSLTFAHL